MHNAPAAIEPAFYDHEDDAVQRDRAAADWGADEVFAAVPRRRFRGEHRPAASPLPRRVAVRETATAPVIAEDAAERAAWLAEVEAEMTAPAAVEAAPVPLDAAALTDGVELAEPAAWTEAPAEPAGRRTVTITGRPGAPAARPRPLVPERRRPAPTVGERIGSRPDRVAGWSFGMGLLLIVVAAFS